MRGVRPRCSPPLARCLAQDVQSRVNFVELDATSPAWPVNDAAFDVAGLAPGRARQRAVGRRVWAVIRAMRAMRGARQRLAEARRGTEEKAMSVSSRRATMVALNFGMWAKFCPNRPTQIQTWLCLGVKSVRSVEPQKSEQHSVRTHGAHIFLLFRIVACAETPEIRMIHTVLRGDGRKVVYKEGCMETVLKRRKIALRRPPRRLRPPLGQLCRGWWKMLEAPSLSMKLGLTVALATSG